MKKIFMALMVFSFLFILAGCDKESEEGSSFDTVVATLTDANYIMTVHDSDARTYFSTNTVANLGLDLSVTGLSIGYLDGSNWVQVVAFESSADASAYKTALTSSDTSVLVYQDGNTIVQTYTQAVLDEFE